MNTPDKIEDPASLWVIRLERGLTAAEQDELLEWLMADPRHGAELSVQKQNWRRLNVLADWRPEHAPRPNRDLLAPAAAGTTAGFASSRQAWRSVALAAAAAVAIGMFWLNRSEPASNGASRAGSVPTPARIATIERRTLEDGSVIELNRGAEVAVNYSASERRVRLLRGEASFIVAKHAARPFIVTAAGVDVRAVGTIFNVRLRDAAVDVVVTEGSVHVHPPESANEPSNASRETSRAVVVAGQRTSVQLATPGEAPEVFAVGPAQLARLLAWQPRLLDFTEQPLHAVVEEFNRRNAPVRIVVADPALADLVVSASLRSDNIEGFLRLMEGGFGVAVDREGSVVTLRKANGR